MASREHIPSLVWDHRPDYIESTYEYQTTEVVKEGKKTVRRRAVLPRLVAVRHLDQLRAHAALVQVAVPKATQYQFRTERKKPKLGLMLVGWGGNNGSTTTAGARRPPRVRRSAAANARRCAGLTPTVLRLADTGLGGTQASWRTSST